MTSTPDDETPSLLDRFESGGPFAAALVTGLAQAVLVELSRWIDTSPSYQGISAETANWRRVAKVAEEAGEAITALGGWVGENPRKGQTNDLAKVIYELLDTATAALGAVEHLTGNQGTALALLDAHLVQVGTRAGVVPPSGSARETATMDAGQALADARTVRQYLMFEENGEAAERAADRLVALFEGCADA